MMSRYDAYTDSVDCARCNGEGIYNEETCFECHGCGWVSPSHQYEPEDDRPAGWDLE